MWPGRSRLLKGVSGPADARGMSRPPFLIAVVIAVACAVAVRTGAAPAGAAASAAARARTHGQAEQDVLAALSRGWGRRRIRVLYNSRTRLLRDNTQAVCHRTRSRGGRRRFLCIVRPARHRRGQGLYVSYRSLAGGRFTIRWLFYRSGR
jgi:hypothetical protein